jgi:hypothetical protein
MTLEIERSEERCHAAARLEDVMKTPKTLFLGAVSKISWTAARHAPLTHVPSIQLTHESAGLGNLGRSPAWVYRGFA